MLCLSRMRGQSIMIGEYIRVQVAEIRGDKVRLLISAPDSVEVDRLEIRVKKNAAKQLAAAGG